jgi:hypothetical protein
MAGSGRADPKRTPTSRTENDENDENAENHESPRRERLNPCAIIPGL